MLSTRNVILLVARALILETRIGRWASGNVVLGAEAEPMRLMLAVGPREAVDEGKGVGAVFVLEVAMRRSGRHGIANVGDVNLVSIEAFCGGPWGTEINVNGSMGYGVSNGEESSVPSCKQN